MTSNRLVGTDAVVIGGSIAGLLAARVLSMYFEHVTIIERDALHDEPAARKGQPQARQPHVLLARGLEVLATTSPDWPTICKQVERLQAISAHARWHIAGGYRKQYNSGLRGVPMTRPLLEWQIQGRVVALPNITVLHQCSVEHLLTTPNRTRVTGVRVVYHGERLVCLCRHGGQRRGRRRARLSHHLQ